MVSCLESPVRIMVWEKTAQCVSLIAAGVQSTTIARHTQSLLLDGLTQSLTGPKTGCCLRSGFKPYHLRNRWPIRLQAH